MAVRRMLGIGELTYLPAILRRRPLTMRRMAIIHNTTMNPGKLDLLAAWLPAQPWYRQTGQEPELARAGGFRLDDPAGRGRHRVHGGH